MGTDVGPTWVPGGYHGAIGGPWCQCSCSSGMGLLSALHGRHVRAVFCLGLVPSSALVAKFPSIDFCRVFPPSSVSPCQSWRIAASERGQSKKKVSELRWKPFPDLVTLNSLVTNSIRVAGLLGGEAITLACGWHAALPKSPPCASELLCGPCDMRIFGRSLLRIGAGERSPLVSSGEALQGGVPRSRGHQFGGRGGVRRHGAGRRRGGWRGWLSHGGGGGAGPETDHARHDAERWRASAAAAGRGAASSGRAASCPALAMVARASRASETSCRAHSCIDAIDHVKESTLRARGLGNVES